MDKYTVINTVRGNRLEAIKLFADKHVSGNIDGVMVDGLPVLNLRDGRALLIGEDYVTMLKEVPVEAKKKEEEKHG